MDRIKKAYSLTMTAQRRPARMDEPFDVEELARTLDEVILRSPISPTKAWDFYRLTFGEDHGEDHNGGNLQTIDPGGFALAGNDSNQVPSTSTAPERLQLKARNNNAVELKELDSSTAEAKCVNTGRRFGTGIASSLIRSDSSVNDIVNGNLAGEQKRTLEPTQIPSDKLSQATAPTHENGLRGTGLKQSPLLFTTEHIGTRCVSLAEHNTQCLPLSGEKVKTVTAVPSKPIDIHGLTLPYADEEDISEAGRYATSNQLSQSLPDKFPNSDIVESKDQASAMYRYGYSTGGDSSYRRLSNNSSGLLSGFRGPSFTPRSSYSRPTMISSLSYTNSPRDSSYTSSSLRRSTSLGSDRPYYSSSGDYSSGSRLNYYQTSPRMSEYRRPITYTRSNTAENVPNSDNGSASENSTEPSINNTDGQNSDDKSRTVDREHFTVTEPDVTDGNSKNKHTPEFQKDYRYESSSSASRNLNTETQSNTEKRNRDRDTAIHKQNNKATSRMYVNMNYNEADLDSRTIKEQTSMPEKINCLSENKNISSLNMASFNLIQDGQVDKKKVVSQLTLNSKSEKQNRHTHNRQIWSRTDDSTNLTSDNSSHNSERNRSPVISRRHITEKTAVDTTFKNIDSKPPVKPSQLTLKAKLTTVENKPPAQFNSYSTPHYSVTAKPWQSTMGGNVESTQSTESADLEQDANMDGRGRRSDSRDTYRNRHKSEEEDYVLTESTASFVYKNGQWVSEDTLDNEQNSSRTRSDPTPSPSVRPGTVPWYLDSPSQRDSNSDNTSSRYNRSYSQDIPDRPTSLSSTGSGTSIKYESATSGPDSPGISSTSYHSKGANSGKQTEDKSQRQDSHTAMDLYTERMNIISGFDKDSESPERPKQTVIREKLQISLSPPTFTVGESNEAENSGRYSGQTTDRINSSSSYLKNDPELSRLSNSSSTSKSADRTRDKSRHASYDSGTKGPLTSPKSRSEAYVTPYYVTEPPDEEIERQDSNTESVFIDDKNNDNGRSRNDSGSQSSQISADSFTLDGRRGREEPGLFQSKREREESRRDLGKPTELTSPAGVGKTGGSSDTSIRWYNAGNVNRENDTTSSGRSSLVNKSGSGLTSEKSNKGGHNEVTVDGSDAKTSTRDVSRVGEKNSLSANERLDTVSTTERPAPTTQLSGNTSVSDSLQHDDGLLHRDTDTGGFSQLESMSNNQMSERRGGIYYSGNISRRNVTGLLASEHEDRRRALGLSQTETQRIGEMVQTNDTPGNRSELRQTHAGQTSTRRAAGVEVSKDGDLSRSRDVTDTVDRSRTDTAYKSENSSGGVDVSKVREDRQVHRHQDRKLQSEIKKDGREVRRSSSSQSESAKVSRVTESGDSRVSQRQERHFKSSKVTKSSRTSDSSFSGDDSLRKLRFGSDDSDDEWSSNRREIEADPSSNEVDRFKKDKSDSETTNDPTSDPYRETIVHENKAAELLTNSVTRTDREGVINLSEERQRGVLDRGVTRNISDDGGLRTQRVQQRSQVQSARRTASSSNYSRTSGSSRAGSGTVSAEDEEVILAALLGRLGEKEVEPFSPENFPTAMGTEDGTLTNLHANLPLVRNTEDAEDDGNALSREEQSLAIAKARQHLQAQAQAQAQVRRPVARKRTIIVDEEMMEEIFLRCIICRDRYNTEERTPKLLPCHHTFCLDCLREMFRVESETRQALVTVYRDTAPSFVTIHCPTCRAAHMITDKEFKTYKSDHKLLELLEISALPTKGSLGYCKTHRTQSTDHFCETCLQAVCTDCKVLDHRDLDGHIVYSREEALRLYANQAYATIRDVDTEDRQLATMETKLKDAIEVINGKLTGSEKLIRQTFDKFKVATNDRQDQLLGKIENEMGNRREDFSNELSEITKRMETIEKTQTTTKQAQEDEDVEQMFTAHQKAREMFKNNFEASTEPKSNIKSSFFYEKRDRANIMNTVSDHGMMTFQS